jgi:GTPase Era involved in 16S rRNA processing
MLGEYQQLVDEIRDLTGAAAPALMEEDAPVLADDALNAGSEEMYLIGIIGGKDVGKSALVNALVGQEITARTSFGPGTEIAVAYAHEDQKEDLANLLQREAPGQFRIVTHRIDHLRRQVLLDLPDIDSHYRSHVELTRRILRHVLFPIWMQSVEKYADKQPQQLLATVALGNAPQNFIFSLNKVDQLKGRDGEAAAQELSEDYSKRVSSLLKIKPPQIWMLSAIQPERYDLPELRKLLSQERSEKSVHSSRKDALNRQGLSLADWVARQDLEHRLQSMQRLSSAAEEEVAARLGSPILESVVPRLQEDPAYRMALADELMEKRVAKWPIVNLLHILLSPLVSITRRRLPLPQQFALESPDSMVSAYLQSLPTTRSEIVEGEAPLAGRSTAATVQSTFAFLHQSFPAISRLYWHWKLWESMPAQLAESDLRRRMSTTVERQRSRLREQLKLGGVISAFFRTLLTVGALLWFPIVQPLLEAFLAGHTIRDLTLFAVRLFGVTYLLKSVTFLIIYYILLWLILRWDTQRRIDKFLWRWQDAKNIDPTLSLTGQAVEWLNELLAPIRSATERLQNVVQRADQLKKSLEAA